MNCNQKIYGSIISTNIERVLAGAGFDDMTPSRYATP
jgi:hypothetical protein